MNSSDWIAVGTYGSTLATHDVIIGRYDQFGNPRWTVKMDGYWPGSEFTFRHFETDGSGNIYVVGQLRMNSASPYNVMAMRILASTGAVQWTRVVDGSQSGGSEDVADTDFDGNLYIAGNVTNAARGYVLKMMADGTLLWIRQHAGTSTRVRCRSLLVDRSNVPNQVYVLNTNLDGSGNIISDDLTKFTTAGTQLWNRSMTDPGNQLEFMDMIISEGTNPILAGYTSNFLSSTVTGKIRELNSSNGVDVWDRSFTASGSNSSFTKIVATLGYFYVGGDSTPFYNSALVAKYLVDGTYQWHAIYSPPAGSTSSYFKDLTLDYVDRPYVLATYGSSSSNAGSSIVRYTSTGYLQYEQTMHQFQERMSGFALNPWSGQVAAGGSRTGYAVLWGTNQNPLPATDNYSVLANHTNFVPVSVLANDRWTTGVVPTVAVAPSHGTVTLWSTGSFTYTPTAGYTGTDTFQYRVGRPGCFYTNAPVNLSVH